VLTTERMTQPTQSDLHFRAPKQGFMELFSPSIQYYCVCYNVVCSLLTFKMIYFRS